MLEYLKIVKLLVRWNNGMSCGEVINAEKSGKINTTQFLN